MKKLLPLLLCTLSTPLCLCAGILSGKVVPRGADAGSAAGGGKYDSRKYKFVEKVDYSQMRDFVVNIEGEFEGINPPEGSVEVISQNGAQFEPHILPVMAGTTVRWPNRDTIYHNVFSYSDPKPFDLGFYKGEHGEEGELKQVIFDKPGRVDVFCAIHKDMHCIVLVLPNPFFAKTDATNSFRIEGIPPGEYTVKVWHERMPTVEQQVTVPVDGEANVEIIASLDHLPKY